MLIGFELLVSFEESNSPKIKKCATKGWTLHNSLQLQIRTTLIYDIREMGT